MEVPESERRVRALADSGDLAGAATEAIREYGPGVIGWLRAITSSPEEADEIFAAVCEKLWKALPGFQWRGSVRTWMYVSGRNAVIDRRRSGGRRREIPLSQSPPLAAVIRSTTTAFRKTEAKGRLRELRDALEPDDRTLLILRVDRSMAWREIAEVLCGHDADADEVRKTSARIRKQFERIKTKLRAQWEQG